MTKLQIEKKIRIDKAIPYNKGTSQGITIFDRKLCYTSIVIKMSWYLHKKRHMDQRNQIEDLDINPCTYKQLIFDKKAIIYNRKRETYLANGAGIIGPLNTEDYKTVHIFCLHKTVKGEQ